MIPGQGRTMSSITRLLQLLGINAVPIVGLFLGGWSTATALALYWAETLTAVLLTAARIAIHRRLTHKKGHLRPQLGIKVGSGTRGQERPVRFSSLFTEFLTGGLMFSLVHGVFLFLVLAFLVPSTIDFAALRPGIYAMLGFQLAGFAGDLYGIGERPFAWIRARAQEVLGRTVLIHLALIGGLVALHLLDRPLAFFGPFAVLKALADLAGLLPRREAPALPDTPPRWAARIAARSNPGSDPVASWRQQIERERALEAADEEVEGEPGGEAQEPAPAVSTGAGIKPEGGGLRPGRSRRRR